VDWEAFYRQKTELRDIMPNLMTHVFWKRHQEADDLIQLIIKRHVNPDKDRVTIVSSDKDFKQLLSPSVSIFNPYTNRVTYENTLYSAEGIYPDQVVDYLILAGDKSDNIPGVNGMGKVRITKFLEQFGTIEGYLEVGKPTGWDKYNIAGVYGKNRKLIDLNLFYIKHLRKVKIPQMATPVIDIPKVLEYLRKYEIKAFPEASFVNFKTLK
jgi:5'-3' exonuclease